MDGRLEGGGLGRLPSAGVPRALDLPRIPLRGHYDERARMRRLDFLRDATARPLLSLQSTTLPAERLTKNIENMIGAVEVPVGIAGPLLFAGRATSGLLYAPMAT